MRNRANYLLALIRVGLIAFVTLFYLALHAWRIRGVGLLERRRMTSHLFQQWCNRLCRILGIVVEIRGPLPPNGSLLVPNHQSYLDVLALGSATGATFLSKAEVDRWPVFGFLLRRAEQLYVHRDRSRRLLETVRSVRERLAAGFSVCVFLEGTTSSGADVLRFHPSLLQPALDGEAPVAPVGIVWTADRPGVLVSRDVAYWGDHVFGSHLLRVLGLRGIRASVRFGSAVKATGERTELAEALHRQVRELRLQEG